MDRAHRYMWDTSYSSWISERIRTSSTCARQDTPENNQQNNLRNNINNSGMLNVCGNQAQNLGIQSLGLSGQPTNLCFHTSNWSHSSNKKPAIRLTDWMDPSWRVWKGTKATKTVITPAESVRVPRITTKLRDQPLDELLEQIWKIEDLKENWRNLTRERIYKFHWKEKSLTYWTRQSATTARGTKLDYLAKSHWELKKFILMLWACWKVFKSVSVMTSNWRSCLYKLSQQIFKKLMSCQLKCSSQYQKIFGICRIIRLLIQQTRKSAHSGKCCDQVLCSSYLIAGPDLLNNLVGPSCHSFCNEGMFMQIAIRHENQSSLRFLWTNGEMVSHYQFTRLIFGANSSPVCSIFVLNRCAEDNAIEIPSISDKAVFAIKTNFISTMISILCRL